MKVNKKSKNEKKKKNQLKKGVKSQLKSFRGADISFVLVRSIALNK